MIRKLDQRGVAAIEFCIAGAAIFVLIFVIFDFGRYAITVQSLRTLANAGARATIIKCYTPAVVKQTSTAPSNCTDITTYFPEGERLVAAPFLYPDGALTNPKPSLGVLAEANALKITATYSFTPVTPLVWGQALNTATVITRIPL